MRILLVEDEKDLASNIKKGLNEQGYVVDIALDGEEGLVLAETESYDLIILDLMLPKIDGLTVCKNIREKAITTPILMLTARSSIEDKIEGFSTGTDDYLTKPFSMAELYIRIKALLRRGTHITLPLIVLDDLKVDIYKHQVYRGNLKLDLTPKEFSILELLLNNKDGVVTRSMILDHVWETDYIGNSNVVDVLVSTLRKKVDKPGKNKLIHTVYGIGFKISENE